MERMTIKKPGPNGGYRLPLIRSNWDVECDKGQADVYGEPIDRLGQYEDLGMDPKELLKELAFAARCRERIKYIENEKK